MRFLPRSLLAKLRRKWRKNPRSKKSNATPSVARPVVPRSNAGLVEASTSTSRPTLSKPTLREQASTSKPIAISISISMPAEAKTVADLFPKTAESRYFGEDGEVLCLARPYWAPFRQVPARSAANSGNKGWSGYADPAVTTTPHLADIQPQIQAVGRSQRVINDVDSGRITVGLGSLLI